MQCISASDRKGPLWPYFDMDNLQVCLDPPGPNAKVPLQDLLQLQLKAVALGAEHFGRRKQLLESPHGFPGAGSLGPYHRKALPW